MSTLKQPRAVADTETGAILAMADLAAPPERIFKLLTDAHDIEQWWGSDDTYRMRQWEAHTVPGGDYTVAVRAANGDVFPASGTFLVVDAPYKLSHTRKYEWDHPTLGRHVTTISFLLQPIEAGTRLTVRHEGFAGFNDAAYEHADGWERVLGWLNVFIYSHAD
ncbi:SRPBCC domain-containing protein [Chitinophaga agrisoli]|uniref:SRPBCC domain-containing protein n=1 Tax=Chitinophaga agrisoli TaxID=2607653 RepID=A0A5B2VM88_9BACT|nr:SRPBCC domain-containing protein [Chitinophaga agrisoli]KAA2240713.1 SRPBCC domain-containing protein [Chitinophaga agrisoli]